MKYILVLSILFSCFLVSAPMPVMAQDEEVIEKTFCAQAIGFTSMDDVRDYLETNAKRLAVNEFFGELISASTAVENLVVTSDQIQASSLGLIRISGSTSFFNGENFGEVCASIEAYVTAADRAQFVPVAVSKRLCLSNDDLSANSLTALVRGEAVIQALYEYDARLEAADRSNLPALVQRITYSEAGFLADTATYCATMTGYVTPVEVLAFGLVDETEGALASSETIGEEDVTGITGAKGAVEPGSPEVIMLSDRVVPDCTTQLAFGQVVRCTINAEGEQQTYTFDANVDDKFYVTLMRVEGDLAPQFVVRDRNAKVVPTGYSGGCSGSDPSGLNSRVCTAERSGQFTLAVSAAESDTTGTYRLTIQRLNPPGYATPIVVGTPVAGEVSERGHYNYYAFSADRDDRFVVKMARTSGDLAPGFRVWDKNGNSVETGYSGGCSAEDSRAAESRVCTVELSGQFYIETFRSEADTTGTYTLTVQKQN